MNDKSCSATLQPNAQNDRSLSAHYAITPPVQISCANLKILALVLPPSMRMLEYSVAEYRSDLPPIHTGHFVASLEHL
jgi:hypothetical protein